jgi:hypothetical protein
LEFAFGAIGVGMKRVIISAICVTIIFVSLGSGCIEPPTEYNSYYYSIKIVGQLELNYTVYAPIAYEHGSNYSMRKILRNAWLVEGEGSFGDIWTDYGQALRIKSNSSIHLIAEYEDTGEYHPLSLSMLVRSIANETKEHWVYCNSTEHVEFEISITLRSRAGECCGEVRTEITEPEFQTISSEGWQKIITSYIVMG